MGGIADVEVAAVRANRGIPVQISNVRGILISSGKAVGDPSAGHNGATVVDRPRPGTTSRLFW